MSGVFSSFTSAKERDDPVQSGSLGMSLFFIDLYTDNEKKEEERSTISLRSSFSLPWPSNLADLPLEKSWRRIRRACGCHWYTSSLKSRSGPPVGLHRKEKKQEKNTNGEPDTYTKKTAYICLLDTPWDRTYMYTPTTTTSRSVSLLSTRSLMCTYVQRHKQEEEEGKLPRIECLVEISNRYKRRF